MPCCNCYRHIWFQDWLQWNTTTWSAVQLVKDVCRARQLPNTIQNDFLRKSSQKPAAKHTLEKKSTRNDSWETRGQECWWFGVNRVYEVVLWHLIAHAPLLPCSQQQHHGGHTAGRRWTIASSTQHYLFMPIGNVAVSAVMPGMSAAVLS